MVIKDLGEADQRIRIVGLKLEGAFVVPGSDLRVTLQCSKITKLAFGLFVVRVYQKSCFIFLFRFLLGRRE